MDKKSNWKTPQLGRLKKGEKDVGTDDIWPHSAARRGNRNGPRGKMGAGRI
jgi:hypothetical protein